MFSLYNTVLICTAYVLFSLICGFVFSAIVPKGSVCRQITGFAMEFSAGFTVSVVILGLIPAAYSRFRTVELLLFLILGICVSMILQEKLKYSYRIMSEKRRLAATGKLSAFSFAFESFIRGLSVGTGFGLSSCLGIGLGAASAIGAFPNGTAFFLLLKSSGKSNFYRFISCILLTVPFFFGSVLGAYIGNSAEVLFLRLLVFSGGVTLYTTAGDMSLESKLLCHGRFIPVFNILGMILGIAVILFN